MEQKCEGITGKQRIGDWSSEDEGCRILRLASLLLRKTTETKSPTITAYCQLLSISRVLPVDIINAPKLVGAEPRSVQQCIAQRANPIFGFSLLRHLSQAAERVEPDFGADGEGGAPPVVEEV